LTAETLRRQAADNTPSPVIHGNREGIARGPPQCEKNRLTLFFNDLGTRDLQMPMTSWRPAILPGHGICAVGMKNP